MFGNKDLANLRILRIQNKEFSGYHFYMYMNL